jgi:hypothetical protein
VYRLKKPWKLRETGKEADLWLDQKNMCLSVPNQDQLAIRVVPAQRRVQEM